jgi:hypothetical protein
VAVPDLVEEASGHFHLESVGGDLMASHIMR